MREIKQRERLVDAETAAHLTDMKADTWRKWGREGRIPVVKIGRSIRFRLSDLEVLISSRSGLNEEDSHDRIEL